MDERPGVARQWRQYLNERQHRAQLASVVFALLSASVVMRLQRRSLGGPLLPVGWSETGQPETSCLIGNTGARCDAKRTRVGG